MVMAITGHRSLEGVRSYKRTPSLQQEVLSNYITKDSVPKSTTLPQNQKPKAPQNQQLLQPRSCSQIELT